MVGWLGGTAAAEALVGSNGGGHAGELIVKP